jgi:bifunctional DNase/RNase
MTLDDHMLHPVTVVNLYEEQGEFLVVLQDDLERMLAIPVGACGWQAIRIALERKQFERPLTHELFLAIADSLDATVHSLIIDDVSNGIFYARLLLTTPDGQITLDCRPSDGITAALRTDAPIFAADAVMETGEE